MGSLHQKTKDKLELIRKLIAEGSSVDDATAKVKMAKSFYYNAKKKLASDGELKPATKIGKKKNYQVIPIASEKPDFSCVFVGTPDQAAAFWARVKGAL